MGGALAGIKIIETASYVTGPFAAQLLADMGAEVIKLEEPKRGDPFRGWGDESYSPTFESLNRNKKSVALDLRSEEGRAEAARPGAPNGGIATPPPTSSSPSSVSRDGYAGAARSS